LPFEAIEPLKSAEVLAIASKQQALIHRATDTLGTIYADSGDVSNAIEKYSRALEIAQQLGDLVAEARTWGNLGVALLYSADCESAVACQRRVVDITQDLPSLHFYKLRALNNIAVCSIHSEDYARGLHAARLA